MAVEKVTLSNEVGLHARPASKFIRESIKYKSDIFLEKDGKRYNGKSIMSVLSMGAQRGEELLLHAEGEDADEAVHNLARLLKSEIFD